MAFTWICAVKDLQRFARDRLTFAAWLGIPLFIVSLLGVMFGRGDTRPHGKLLVADLDGTFFSRFLSHSFDQGQLKDMVMPESVSVEEGRRLMDQGGASALVIIPKGFSAALLGAGKAEITLVKNPSQRIMPQMIEETLAILLEGAFYLQEIGGREIREAAASGKGLADPQAMAAGVALLRTANLIAVRVEQPPIELETEVIATKQTVSMGGAFFPGMMVLAFLFSASGLSGDLWRERRFGTIRRVATTPGRLESLLAGKLVAVATVFALVATAGLAAGCWWFGLDWKQIPLAVVWLVIAGCGLFLLLVYLQALSPSERGGTLIANLIMFPLGMLGGSFFPFEVMPRWMAAVGRLTPNGWAVTQLRQILADDVNWTVLASSAGGFVLLSAVLFVISSAWLRRRAAD